jgi:hypothetical protein
MFQKPIEYFLIGLALFLFAFGILTSGALGLPQQADSAQLSV